MHDLMLGKLHPQGHPAVGVGRLFKQPEQAGGAEFAVVSSVLGAMNPPVVNGVVFGRLDRVLLLVIGQNNRRGAPGEGESAVINRIGLSVRALSAQEKSQLKTRGSIVVVEATGPAAEAGIRSGDVILSINRESAGSVDEFQKSVKNAGRSATLLVQRDNQQSIITITLQ